ncbi:hypothetical protein GCM10011579_092550 [Streptomyces albiflavescens]|uniref:Tc1-like transposase DDE domain-containing protein n=1 Tax=Streptomyces albiflavescens TaxID=1623582 RepID=A0A918DAW8_9ACTN|nr:hypothetical protein GCM10011579_092550 [Streptomyces albiflavescens]
MSANRWRRALASGGRQALASKGPGGARCKGFTETDCARLLDAAHQQPGGPVVLVRDNLNTHANRTMHELIAADYG